MAMLLHRRRAPLALGNIWDAGEARVIADARVKAVVTGRRSIATAQGFPYGETVPLDFLLRSVERMVQTVDIPESLDFEGGYAADRTERYLMLA